MAIRDENNRGDDESKGSEKSVPIKYFFSRYSVLWRYHEYYEMCRYILIILNSICLLKL